MAHTIFSDIQLPVEATRAQVEPKYPLAKLDVGQVFFELPKEGEVIEKTLKRVVGATVNARKKLPLHTFTCFITVHPNTLEPAVGTWRVADRAPK